METLLIPNLTILKSFNNEKGVWKTPDLTLWPKKDREMLIEEHSALILKLKMLGTLLSKSLGGPKDKKYFREALLLAEILVQVYEKYINSLKEIPYLRECQITCRQALGLSISGLEKITPDDIPCSLPEGIRDSNSFVNFIRLCAVRLRKIL